MIRLPARRPLSAERVAPYLGLAALAWIPLFLHKWGRIGADTKVYLYLDPGRLLSRATSMWDPTVGMGTVTHQTIGYLFPMGPYYWVAQHVGVANWVAQRCWLGLCLFAAGAGMVYLLRTLAWRGAGVTVAAMAYMLSPYFLDYAAKHSVIALPWSGLPWLLAFTIRSVRHRGWRDPALFAMVVQLVGGVNAPALALVGVAPLLWLPYAVWVNRECTVRQVTGVVGRIGAITAITSLWWVAGLYAQSAYGIAILKYTETAKTVANASTAPEVLRGLGYWFFYGGDKYGNFVDVGTDYTQRLWLLALSFAIPLAAFVGAAIARFRERAYFLLLVLFGTILSVGAHPWNDPPVGGGLIKAVLTANIGLAVRSLPRAVPLIALGTSVLLGAAVTALLPRLPRRPALLGVGAVGLLLMANNPPLFNGGTIASGLSRPDAIPQYWKDDARYLDSKGHATRVLEVPGSDFASYRWGTTVDPITPGLMDRPYVARELISYGSPPSADLLNALDRQMQENVLDPQALAPVARFMSAGDINVRSDLTYERYDLPRPRSFWDFLTHAPGLGRATGFGGNAPNIPVPRLPLLDEQELQTPPALPNPPKVAALPVTDAQPIIRTAPDQHPVVLAGDGEGLVDTSAAGLLHGDELVLYAASFAKDATGLRRAAAKGASLVLTDTNRRRARRWGTVHENTGVTERAGETALKADPSDNRLDVFPDAGDRSATVAEDRGGVTASATGYGNPVSYTPENRAANAVDATPDGKPDLNSAWRVGGFAPVNGEKLELHWDRARTTDHIRFTQALTGVRNRFITKVGLRFDGGKEITETLGDDSRQAGGQVVRFPSRTFHTLDIIIRDTEITIPGLSSHSITRYDGVAAVGFADVALGDHDPRLDEVIRLPQDLLGTLGRASVENPLAVVLTRIRTRPTSAVRSDEEVDLVRSLQLPGPRSFAVSGEARLSAGARDTTLDQVLGLPTPAQGGVATTTSRRLPGDLGSRGSAAVDNDPTTWWSPGFLGQEGESLRFTTPQPVTFDHLNLSVLADGRHSVPTRLRIEQCHPDPSAPASGCRGTPVAAVDVAPITDSRTPNAIAPPQRLSFALLTGADFQVVIEKARPVRTNDWFSLKPIDMPVGIVDLGIPGVSVSKPAGLIDPKCRTGLLQADGKDVPISLRGTVADALAGRPLGISLCSATPTTAAPTGVNLSGGDHVLRSTAGTTTGINLDQLVLRSTAGGTADPATGPLVAPATTRATRAAPTGTTSPKVTVVHSGHTGADLRVTGTGQPFWLVFGQSHNLGWTATADGHDLGPPTLVDGYANGWPVPALHGTINVHVTWTPQRVVNVLLWLSVLGAVVMVALIVWPMRHRLAPVADERRPMAIDVEPSRPRPFTARRVLRYAGARPRPKAAVVTVLLALVGFGAFIGPLAGVLVAVATVSALRFPRSRPLLTLGGPALLAFSGAYVVFEQHRHRYPAGFEWPIYFASVHQAAWVAVALLVVDATVDRLWLRRWWPTDDSPS